MSRARRPRRLRPARAEASFDAIEFLRDEAFGTATAVDPKTLQLCAQARRALEFAIGVECRDEWLNDLEVMAVTPEPTVRRLRVWLLAPRGADAAQRAEALSRLQAARGFLRAQVAGAIHRKRTPELVFELLPATAAAEGLPS